MATFQSFFCQDNSTLANFKAWGQFISNAFRTLGWQQSADSNQVNWSTISSVPAGSNVYEIWQMGDALQSVNPVFVQVWYGFSNPRPFIWFMVGSASNGSGVLSNASAQIGLGPQGNGGGAAVTYECDIAGGNNRFHMCMWRGAAQPDFFSIERSHDASGNDTASYVTYLAGGSNLGSPIQQTILPASVYGPMAQELNGLTFQTSATSANFATSTAAVPFYPMVGKVDNPLMGALCIKANDFADGAQFSATMYGAAHNYLVIKSVGGAWGANGSTGNAVAMRFE